MHLIDLIRKEWLESGIDDPIEFTISYMKSYCYFPKDTKRRKLAVSKAQNRARVTEQWLSEGNRITPSTLKEFEKLMRKADREFKSH